ncbi:DNA-binding XRE family transcriptional regulator [Pseudarthrobacter enclensis]|uniref:DNA-binding XRE family transcriptional regulator n=1 Tax=Pseudarthrobacter enclensis TaxID=993070 RepID=A0ABT9RZ33_9MICC|nr:DNA-binding XRE family transcriptional regulator [Pseudarthrobacter enclensis]
MDFAQLPFAKHAEVDLKTLRSLEKGGRLPSDTTLNKVEKVFHSMASHVAAFAPSAAG